jgi:hypothetical protein
MQDAWFSAFFHGLGSGIWTATIDINSHGEVYLELFLWCVMNPIIIYGGYLNLKQVYNTYDNKQENGVLL